MPLSKSSLSRCIYNVPLLRVRLGLLLGLELCVTRPAVTNITCDFGDGDIICSRSRLPHGHAVSSIIVRLLEGARASTGLSLLCLNVGYKHFGDVQTRGARQC